MNALRAGALAVVEKPVGTNHAVYEAVAGRLCTQLAIMSEVKVIRQRYTPGARPRPRGRRRRPRPARRGRPSRPG